MTPQNHNEISSKFIPLSEYNQYNAFWELNFHQLKRMAFQTKCANQTKCWPMFNKLNASQTENKFQLEINRMQGNQCQNARAVVCQTNGTKLAQCLARLLGIGISIRRMMQPLNLWAWIKPCVYVYEFI